MRKIIAIALLFMTLIFFSACGVRTGTASTFMKEVRGSDKDQLLLTEFRSEVFERQHLERIASELSSFLADNEFRAFISAQFRASPKTNTIVLREAFAAAARQGLKEGDVRLFRLAVSVQEAETIMKHSPMPIPRIDLMLPVAAHRDLLQDSDTLYIAVAPLADESEVESITAYSNGDRLTLRANEPPGIPTFVVAPAETESLDPDYPLTISEEPQDEKNKDLIVDDFVGISWISISKDHEPWHKGDPEIEVRFRRWLTEPGVFKDNKVELKSVNNEDKWYFLGDPNSTYLYMDDGYQPSIEIAVWELDGTDSDDFVGLFIPNWKSLPFGGYTEGTALGTIKDARIFLDRD